MPTVSKLVHKKTRRQETEMVIGFEEVFFFYKEEIKLWNDFSLDNKQEKIITHIFLCQLSWENNFKSGYTHYKHKE